MRLKTTKIFKYLNDWEKTGIRTIALQGGSRSGKTYNIVMWLLVKALKEPRLHITIARLTLTASKRSCLLDLLAILEAAGNIKYKYNSTACVITFPNKSKIEFIPCDKEEKLRGLKRDILFINEATELSYSRYYQLNLRTTKRVIMDFNPTYSNYHWLVGVLNSENCKLQITTYKDNDFLTPPEVATIEEFKETSPSLWRIYGLGLQGLADTLIFDNFEVREEPTSKVKYTIIGVDFGFTNDPTAIIEVCYCEDKSFFLREICYNTKMIAKDIANALDGYKEHIIVADSADPRLIAELGILGIPVIAAKKNKILHDIHKLKAFKIYLDKSSKNLQSEFTSYEWMKINDMPTNIPIDKNNHLIDAFRYAANEIIKYYAL